VDGAPHVLVDHVRLVGSPDQTAAEKGGEQGDAIVELNLAARHVELIAKPVDIKEWS